MLALLISCPLFFAAALVRFISVRTYERAPLDVQRGPEEGTTLKQSELEPRTEQSEAAARSDRNQGPRDPFLDRSRFPPRPDRTAPIPVRSARDLSFGSPGSIAAKFYEFTYSLPHGGSLFTVTPTAGSSFLGKGESV